MSPSKLENKIKLDESDATFVPDDSIVIKNSQRSPSSTIKKKKNKSNRDDISSQNGNYSSQFTENYSQSLLKVKKKKHKKHKHENVQNSNLQSQSFLNGLNGSFFTDDSESINGDININEKSNDKEKCEFLKKKKKKKSIEFRTQEIFKQFSSESLNSAPSSTPKKRKVSDCEFMVKDEICSDVNNSINSVIDSDGKENNSYLSKKDKKKKVVNNMTNSLNNVTDLVSDLNDTEIVPHKKTKKKNRNETSEHNSVNIEANNNKSSKEFSDVINKIETNGADNGSDILWELTPVKKKKHKVAPEDTVNDVNLQSQGEVKLGKYSPSQSFGFDTSEIDSVADLNGTEIFLPHKKRKKKNHHEYSEHNSVNIEANNNTRDENTKKRKYSIFSHSPEEFSNVVNTIETNGVENGSDTFGELTSVGKKKKKKHKVAPEDTVHDIKLESKSKVRLGEYSPSQSFGFDTSDSKSIVPESQDLRSNTTDTHVNLKEASSPCYDNVKDEIESLDGEVQIEDNMDSKMLEFIKMDSYDVPFEIPRLHQIANRASKPTIEQRTLIVSENLKVKAGKFSKDEDKQIKENWQHFIQVHNLNDRPEQFFSMHNNKIPLSAKKIFLYYLSKHMPERFPYSIFWRFRLLMADIKRGRFSEEEDDFIVKLMKKNDGRPGTITEIAHSLKRTPQAVEKRIAIMRSTYKRKIKWKPKNAATFIKYLLKVTKIPEQDISQLENRHISSKEWTKLSKKLDDVPIRILKQAWLKKLYPELFIPEKTCDLRKVKMRLIQMLHHNKETDWRRVNWNRYTSHFPGLTPLKVYTLAKQLVKSYVPPEKQGNLNECLPLLIKLDQSMIRKQMIYKVCYENGVIKNI